MLFFTVLFSLNLQTQSQVFYVIFFQFLKQKTSKILSSWEHCNCWPILELFSGIKCLTRFTLLLDHITLLSLPHEEKGKGGKTLLLMIMCRQQ